VKILINLTSLITVAFTMLRGNAVQTADASLPSQLENWLPDGISIPEQLPSEIKDPILLAAWVVLYNHIEPVRLYAGMTLNGRSLAEFAREKNIPVLWGSDEICNGSSCARRITCASLACLQEYQEQPIQPIYVKAQLKEPGEKQLSYLVKVLAHEIYHQTLPFGPVKTSLYEEFYAFYIGTQISKAGWMKFEDYDPLKAVCLKRWFVVYTPKAYQDLDLYPISLTEEVDLLSETCTRS